MKKAQQDYSSRSSIPENEPAYKFGDRLKEQMKKAGYTQRSLAIEMDVSIDTIKAWCQHRTFPGYLHLGKLCELFPPCSIDYFSGLIDAPNWDIQSVADFTGLTPAAVIALQQMPSDKKEVLSVLLEDHKDNSVNTSALLDYIGTYFSQSHKLKLIQKAERTPEADIAESMTMDNKNLIRYTLTQETSKLLDSISDDYADKYLPKFRYQDKQGRKTVIISDDGIRIL